MIFSPSEKETLLSFSSTERQSAYQFLSGVMIIDGDADICEKKQLEYINTLMRITRSDVESSRQLNQTIIQNVLSLMSVEKRKVLAKCISSIVTADRRIHPKEEQFVGYYLNCLRMDSDWLIPNNNQPFPTLQFGSIKLTETSLRNTSALRKMFSNASFCRSYFGSDCLEIRNRLNDRSESVYVQEQHYKYIWGREIQWIIEKQNSDFLGFVHITKEYPALPNDWVIEFGIEPESQGQGIMSQVLPIVLEYLKSIGLDQPIFAISESYNHPCHKLFRKLQYYVTETEYEMTDQWAGTRMMKLFTIH